MGQVFLNPQGDGTAYCDNYYPNDGEQFTIYCVPNTGAELLDVRAFDSHDYPVAIPVQEIIPMRFRNIWNNLYVDIYFSGVIPPTPTIMPWLLFKIRENNNVK